jgi:hypothetical protein
MGKPLWDLWRRAVFWWRMVENAGMSLFIELDDGKIYRKPRYLMVNTMVSCRFSLKPIH